MTGKKKFDDYRRVRSDLFNVDANYKGFYKHVACPVYVLRQIFKNCNELADVFRIPHDESHYYMDIEKGYYNTSGFKYCIFPSKSLDNKGIHSMFKTFS